MKWYVNNVSLFIVLVVLVRVLALTRFMKFFNEKKVKKNVATIVTPELPYLQ